MAVVISIQSAPDAVDKKSATVEKHAKAVTDWCRDAERSLRTLAAAANTARDSAMAATTGNITLTADSGTVILNKATVKATLPSAATVPGRSFTVKTISAVTTAVALVAVAGQTIDGSNVYAFGAQYEFVTVQSDGSNWHVVAAG
jgi:hypothetical protein